MEIAVQIAQLLVSLSLLVVCHELGHFAAAKIFKCRVDRFYLFFNAFNFSLFKFKRGDTEYGIGWLPLGGYVSIAGMVDETTGADDLAKEPQPWEFRTKPAWQRLIIMLAGIIVNVILAMLIYAMIAFHWGSTYLSTDNLKYGIAVDSLGYSMGLRDGDMIRYVNGEPAGEFNKVYVNMLLGSPRTMTVERGGQTLTIEVDDEMVSKLLDPQIQSAPFMPRFPFVIADIPEDADNAARKAGFAAGDSLTTFNGAPCSFYNNVRDMLEANKGKAAEIGFVRGGTPMTISLTIPGDGKLGVYTKSYADFLEFTHVSYGFFESFPVGISKGVDKIVEYVKQFKLIFNPDTKAYKSVGSFITMTKIFPVYWDWHAFWSLTAFFSVILAVMNLLPIPGLDGGHALFTLIEIITGKKPSDKFLEYAQTVGFIIVVALMVFAIGNDLIKYVFN